MCVKRVVQHHGTGTTDRSERIETATFFEETNGAVSDMQAVAIATSVLDSDGFEMTQPSLGAR